MYYIGLDIHKKIIAYCVKHGGGEIHSQGVVNATRAALDAWMKALPQPWEKGGKRGQEKGARRLFQRRHHAILHYRAWLVDRDSLFQERRITLRNAETTGRTFSFPARIASATLNCFANIVSAMTSVFWDGA